MGSRRIQLAPGLCELDRRKPQSPSGGSRLNGDREDNNRGAAIHHRAIGAEEGTIRALIPEAEEA